MPNSVRAHIQKALKIFHSGCLSMKCFLFCIPCTVVEECVDIDAKQEIPLTTKDAVLLLEIVEHLPIQKCQILNATIFKIPSPRIGKYLTSSSPISSFKNLQVPCVPLQFSTVAHDIIRKDSLGLSATILDICLNTLSKCTGVKAAFDIGVEPVQKKCLTVVEYYKNEFTSKSGTTMVPVDTISQPPLISWSKAIDAIIRKNTLLNLSSPDFSSKFKRLTVEPKYSAISGVSDIGVEPTQHKLFAYIPLETHCDLPIGITMNNAILKNCAIAGAGEELELPSTIAEIYHIKYNDINMEDNTGLP